METQVLKENNLATGSLVNDLLDVLANTFVAEDDALAEKLLELGSNGLQAVLGVLLAIRTAEMGHQDNGLGAVVDGILDGGEGTDNTLVVGDVLVLVKRDVEVNLYARCISSLSKQVGHRLKSFSGTYANQDTLVLQVNVGDGELVRKRHDGGCKWKF